MVSIKKYRRRDVLFCDTIKVVRKMNLYGVSKKELEKYLKEKKYPIYYAKEIYQWIYQKKIDSIFSASNLPNSLRKDLEQDFPMTSLEIIKEQKGKDVSKYLFRLSDKEHIEAVLMRHDYGLSLCISSQVGCNMGCCFCESGRRKKVRNLETYEMVCQILEIEKRIGKRISHVVMMGIGEPFDNYENVVKFIEIVNEDSGMNIGARHLTISTCGIVPKIYEFMNFPYQVNLAVSLHASFDEKRKELMPIAKVYPLKELMTALKKYVEKTNRRLTFEYILLDGINDQEEDARNLAHLLKGINCYVNLIPYNETTHLQYKRSKPLTIAKFYDILKKSNICVTIRREFGGTISAACGQLRSEKEEL